MKGSGKVLLPFHVYFLNELVALPHASFYTHIPNELPPHLVYCSDSVSFSILKETSFFILFSL